MRGDHLYYSYRELPYIQGGHTTCSECLIDIPKGDFAIMITCILSPELRRE